jgi:hypothetical protein
LTAGSEGRKSRFLWEHALSLVEAGTVSQALSLPIKHPLILALGAACAMLLLLPTWVAFMPGTSLALVVSILAAGLPGIFIGGALTSLAFSLSGGERTTPRGFVSTLSLVVRRYPALLVAHIAGLAVVALVLSPLLLMPSFPLAANLLVVTVPVGLYLGARLFCILPAVVLHTEGFVAGFRKNLDVTKGNAWPILVVLLLLGLMLLVIGWLGSDLLVMLMSFEPFPFAIFALLWVCAVTACISTVLSCQTLVYMRLTVAAPGPSEAIEAPELAGIRPETEVPQSVSTFRGTVKEYSRICPPRYNAAYCPYCKYCASREDGKYCDKHHVLL